MKIVVLGGSNAGFAAVNAFRQLNQQDEVVIIEKQTIVAPFISAGIRMALDGQLDDASQLSFDRFQGQPNTIYRQGCIVERIDVKNKKVYVRQGDSGQSLVETFDKLIYALGSSPKVPSFVGSDLNQVVFVKDKQDAAEINQLTRRGIVQKKALVYGGGPVSVELAEALQRRGVAVTFVTYAEQMMTKYFDEPLRLNLERLMRDNGIKIKTNVEVVSVDRHGKQIMVHFSDGQEELYNVMAIAAGLQPNTAMLSGQVEMDRYGAALVNDVMQSSQSDVYVVGDAGVIQSDFGRYAPLLSTAIKMGKVAGYQLAGISDIKLKPHLITMGFEVFGRMYSKTGQTLKQLQQANLPHSKVLTLQAQSTINQVGSQKTVKLGIVFDLKSGRIYGAQIASDDIATTELINVFSQVITEQSTVTELAVYETFFEAEMNLPYALINRIGELAMLEQEKYLTDSALVSEELISEYID
ncbi:FAD-dependent oxidoreductase [Weissella diestrammenae]|uniref:FAD-dependent oxidoreductase n=1 Tax=Weissella diestrammenae TaxID=1162633 RepID=A0A7G9T6J6_9LACO|nr:FAD/NAD(P)-binding oxidoreductase [Weissella diestrammenae]MCM0583223.1 FAD-dependent oxidoreductase [Weissella diestrammenae]QNN75721.1 FAD-dependent oxidoreductase [Weissella diestrammenae]